MPTIKVRKASQQDREAVFQFCKRTWEWGDYIPSVWNIWLRNGDTLVATTDEKPIAILHLQYNNAEAWLEGLRVSDKFRRRGIGTKLVQEGIRQVKRRRKSVLRLAVDLNNASSLKLFSKLGFKETFRFYYLEKKNLNKDKHQVSIATSEHLSKAWNFIKKSEEMKASKGLYANWWRWWHLTSNQFEDIIRTEGCLLYGTSSRIYGLMVFRTNKTMSGATSCQICFMHGSDNAKREMLAKLGDMLPKGKIQYYFSLVPERSKNLKFLQGLNFTGVWRFALMSASLAPTRHP